MGSNGVEKKQTLKELCSSLDWNSQILCLSVPATAYQSFMPLQKRLSFEVATRWHSSRSKLSHLQRKRRYIKLMSLIMTMFAVVSEGIIKASAVHWALLCLLVRRRGKTCQLTNCAESQHEGNKKVTTGCILQENGLFASRGREKNAAL